MSVFKYVTTICGILPINQGVPAQSLSCVRLFVTSWTVAHQALLSMGFSRQEYWSGLPFSPPADLPDSGIELSSPALVGGFFTVEPPGKPPYTKDSVHIIYLDDSFNCHNSPLS